jgi:hypothetical protein
MEVGLKMIEIRIIRIGKDRKWEDQVRAQSGKTEGRK